MTKRRGLGKGLEALIPPSSTPRPVSPEVQAGSIEIAVDQIVPNPHQPRQSIDPESLQELAHSIVQHGLIQPLIVTRIASGYQLIAGERRWRASRLAGLSAVPAIIKETSPQQMLELALVENIQRADLNPLEEAEAYTQLMHEFDLTQEAVAERVGRSRTAVANTVRLLNLPQEIKNNLAGGKISEGHARALLSLKNQEEQLQVLGAILSRGLNVRQTETLVKQLQTSQPPLTPKRPPLSPHDKRLLSRFESRLGTRVELARTDHEAGKITIHFYSQEELQAIYTAIVGEEEGL
ncbi:MAG: ParB/RepB/Spo0J family partition protein [Chloroflexota bacterium]